MNRARDKKENLLLLFFLYSFSRRNFFLSQKVEFVEEVNFAGDV